MAATKSLAPSKTPSSSKPSAAIISLTPPTTRALQPSARPTPPHQAPRSARGRTRAARSLRLRKLRYHPHRAQTMTRNPADLLLNEHLDYLKLTCVKENCQPLAVESAANHWSHLDYLGRLLQGEVAARQQRTIARRIKAARFPVIKTLEGFRWDWPKKINRLQIQDLFRLSFIEEKANVIFLGLVGVGTMPGTGLCRVVWYFPSNDRLSGRHSPGAVRSHSKACESTICALNDSLTNFTYEGRGAHMRPAQPSHRIVSGETGRVRLHASPGPVPSAVDCKARPLVARKQAAPLAAQREDGRSISEAFTR